MAFDKKKYDQDYAKTKYDRIPINVKKGDREIILNHAKKRGFDNVTEYVKHLIYSDMNGNKNISVGNIEQTGDNNTVNIG